MILTDINMDFEFQNNNFEIFALGWKVSRRKGGKSRYSQPPSIYKKNKFVITHGNKAYIVGNNIYTNN